jgi:hypothetical protein
MKRIDIDQLAPGDIVFTASKTLVSKGIRASTFGQVSHAMICVQHGSVIDATDIGVHARSLQRELFEDDVRIYAFRLRGGLSPLQLHRIVQYARSQVAVRYSKTEAVRAVASIRRPRSRWQFCSRLVAQAYAHAGVSLVPDKDYCTPEDLRRCALLYKLDNVIEAIDENEARFWRERADPVDDTRSIQNEILDAVRLLGADVENFEDVVQAALEDPAIDAGIASILRDTGYLGIWRHDLVVNAGHYDLALMNEATVAGKGAEILGYALPVVREFHSGGYRYAATLVTLTRAHGAMPCSTTALLVPLYQTLLHHDERRRLVAHDWLAQHHPAELAAALERIEPHSPLWFEMVDHCEPALGALARMFIERIGGGDICSACGDPATDYRLRNAAEAMAGVPSLRLCTDCVAIRRGFGEVLTPMV